MKIQSPGSSTYNIKQINLNDVHQHKLVEIRRTDNEANTNRSGDS